LGRKSEIFFAVCLWSYFRFLDLILFRNAVFLFAAVHGSVGCGVSERPSSAPLKGTWRSVPGYPSTSRQVAEPLRLSCRHLLPQGQKALLHFVRNMLSIFIKGETVNLRYCTAIFPGTFSRLGTSVDDLSNRTSIPVEKIVELLTKEPPEEFASYTLLPRRWKCRWNYFFRKTGMIDFNTTRELPVKTGSSLYLTKGF